MIGYVEGVLALLVLLAFWAATLCVRVSIWAAHRFEIFARPNARASHTIPTPRLGGLGFASAFYLVLMFAQIKLRLPLSPWLIAVLVGGAWALVGGFLDDVFELKPYWKFLFQLAAAATAVVTGFRPLPVAVEQWSRTILSPILVEILAIIFTVSFILLVMNAYNFMDGMDGQAALFGALVSLAIAMPLVAFDFPYAVGQSVVLLALAGVLFAFLMFNLPTTEQPRKTFMGDSGSQFVGFVLAIAALHTCEDRNSSFPFAAAMIVLSPFLWDVLYTLVRRALRGENLLQAHRTHLYQRLLVAGWTHGRTLALNFVLWSLCFVLAQLDARFWRSELHFLRPLVWLAVLLVHAGYTLFVLFEERKARRAQSD